MNTPRCAHGICHYGVNVYVFGGFWEDEYHKKCEKFDLCTGEWQDISSMPTELTAVTATMVNNQVFIGGCICDSRIKGKEILRYDPITDIFTVTNIRTPKSR